MRPIADFDGSDQKDSASGDQNRNTIGNNSNRQRVSYGDQKSPMGLQVMQDRESSNLPTDSWSIIMTSIDSREGAQLGLIPT